MALYVLRVEVQYIIKKETHPQEKAIYSSIFTVFFVYCVYTMPVTPSTNTIGKKDTDEPQKSAPTVGTFGTFMTTPLRVPNTSANEASYGGKTFTQKPLGQEIISSKDKQITLLEEQLKGKGDEIRTLRDALLLGNKTQDEINTLRRNIEKIKTDLLSLGISLQENSDGTFSIVDTRSRRDGNANEQVVVREARRPVLRSIPILRKGGMQLPTREALTAKTKITPIEKIIISDDSTAEKIESGNLLISDSLIINPDAILPEKVATPNESMIGEQGAILENTREVNTVETPTLPIETISKEETSDTVDAPPIPRIDPFVEPIEGIDTPTLEKKALSYTEAKGLTDALFIADRAISKGIIMTWLDSDFENIQINPAPLSLVSGTSPSVEAEKKHDTVSVLSEESKEVMSFAGVNYENYVIPFFMKLELSEQELLSLATHFGAVTIQDIYFSEKESATNIAISKGNIISVKVPLSACVYQISQLCTRLGAPIELAQKEIKEMTLHQFFVHAKNVVKERWDAMEKEKYMASKAANEEIFIARQEA